MTQKKNGFVKQEMKGIGEAERAGVDEAEGTVVGGKVEAGISEAIEQKW